MYEETKIILLTSKEAQEAKLIEVQERVDRDAQKKAKQEARTKRIQENIKTNQEKIKLKPQKKPVTKLTNHPKPPRRSSQSQRKRHRKNLRKTRQEN